MFTSGQGMIESQNKTGVWIMTVFKQAQLFSNK